MQKIRLNLEELCVDSFATGQPLAHAGTVHAHATPPTYCGATCSPTCNTNCDCTYTCTRGFPATQCTIYP